LIAGAAEVFRVPAFAKSARVASLPNNVTPTIQFGSASGAAVDSFPIAGFPSADLPVMSSSRVFTYNNTSLIGDTQRLIVFELAL
jgi:hypothetical protein